MQTRILKLNNRSFEVHIRDKVDESVANEIFKYREYKVVEPYMQTLTLPLIDVGAHSGLFTLYARSWNQTVPILALEPEPRNFKMLKEHVSRNTLTRVELVQAALADTSRKHKLVITPDSINHFLSPSKNLFTDQETIPVETFSLGDLLVKQKIKQVGLIKMDIEGGEYAIIESLTDELYTKIKAFILEYHDSKVHQHAELEQALREHGFGVQTFPSHFDKQFGFIFAVNKRV